MTPGTSIAFFGATPLPGLPQYVVVSIDGGTPYISSYNDTLAPSSSVQWYQSPLLPDTEHNISLTRLVGVTLDYMVVTTGPTTSLTGQVIIVDDCGPEVIYSGAWTRKQARFERTLGNLTLTGYPHGNATHDTSEAGSKATFRFSGLSFFIQKFEAVSDLLTSASRQDQHRLSMELLITTR